MPGPDPNGVWLEGNEAGGLRVSWETWLHTNAAARRQRAVSILRNVSQGGWCCLWCREPVPLFRRADARYCGESCRKKAARSRRRWAEGRA